MKNQLATLLITILLFFFAVSCGEGTKKTPVDNEISDTINTDADPDEETPDSDNIETDEEIQTDVDVSSEIQEIIDGLDESFLEPSKGFAFKIVAPLLEDIPTTSMIPAEDQPFIMDGGFTDRYGNNVVFDQIKYSYGAKYEESYLYILANSGYYDQTYYTAMVLPSFSTLDWMAQNNTDVANGTFFYLYIYKNDIVDQTLFRTCPDSIIGESGESELKVFLKDDYWTVDGNFGLMVNADLTFDKKELETFFGDEFHKLCTCYDIVGGSYVARDCTPKDMDLEPIPANDATPSNGSENIAVDTELSWTAGSDPDGGDVTYTLYFGTDPEPSEKVFENSDKLSFTPESPLEKNTRYFWQIVTTDDEGNEVKGEIWTFNTNEEVIVPDEHDFLIVVNESIKTQTSDKIDEYARILTDEGYTPFIRYWHPGGAENLRGIIQKSYTKFGIKGAVLIGDMPSAFYEQTVDYGGDIGVNYEQFPSEFYFMDMDGSWTDEDRNGLLDTYPDDMSIEIYTGRIPGTPDQINNYLDRAIKYKKDGSFFETRNFFSFIDDDWIVYEDEDGTVWEDYMGTKNQTWELESVYGENYERREELENTSKTEYLDFLTTEGAEYVYQWIHSDPQNIYFDDNFSPNPANILNISEVRAADIKGSFYNLFDCSISRYTKEGGNMASEYIYGEYGLATLGSTKTGGIFNPEVMNIALAAGESWGTGYQMWVNDIWANHDDYGMDRNFIDSWWLGMMIQGDPTLTLTDKKTFVTKSMIPRKVYTKEFLEMMNRTLRK